jgi:hypothetical protein
MNDSPDRDPERYPLWIYITSLVASKLLWSTFRFTIVGPIVKPPQPRFRVCGYQLLKPPNICSSHVVLPSKGPDKKIAGTIQNLRPPNCPSFATFPRSALFYLRGAQTRQSWPHFRICAHRIGQASRRFLVPPCSTSVETRVWRKLESILYMDLRASFRKCLLREK